MAVEAYNVDGEPIEGLYSPEEVKAMQERLEKLESKDFNFRKLESMTEEEKAKLSAVELSLKQQQEQLEEKQKQFESGFVSDVKKDLFDAMIGDDEDLRKKVEVNYARIKDSDTAKSRDEIKSIIADALAMSVGVKGSNPLNTAINSSGSAPASQPKSGGNIASLGKMLGLTEEDLKDIK